MKAGRNRPRSNFNLRGRLTLVGIALGLCSVTLIGRAAFVQLLLQQGVVAAGVAIESAPPLGVVALKWSLIRAVWPMLGLFSSLKTTFLPSFAQWQYAIANGLPLAEQRAAYEQLAAPESKKTIRGALSCRARVDFGRPHAPLLFLAGGADRLMPAALNRANFRRYRHAQSITEYRELPGRCHALLGQPTWREDAALIARWLATHVA